MWSKEQLKEFDLRDRSENCQRDEKGFPLLSDGTRDEELTGYEKQEFLKKHEAEIAGVKKLRKRTNLTPPKKKRKK